jgi:hypothetical protein
MARRARSRNTKGSKVGLKSKLVAADRKGRSLSAKDIKVRGVKFRASTSGLIVGRTPKRIHDADRTDAIVWIDADGRDHVQAIDMDPTDVGSHDISSDSDA